MLAVSLLAACLSLANSFGNVSDTPVQRKLLPVVRNCQEYGSMDRQLHRRYVVWAAGCSTRFGHRVACSICIRVQAAQP